MNGICRLCIICHDVFDTYSFQLHNSGSLNCCADCQEE